MRVNWWPVLTLILRKLLKIPGMSLYVGGSWGTGDNLSGSLHNLFPVNTLYAPSYYLGELYLQQTLLKNNLTMVVGRLAAASTFATLPVLTNYVNYGINPNPYPLGGNDISFFGPPTGTEWGAQASYNVTPVVQISAGLFNNNLDSANGQNHGTYWTLQQGNKGALVVAEVSYFPHQIANDQGKQGEYTLGLITDNNSFPTFPDGQTKSGGYTGVFAMGQEVVYQPDGPGTPRGLTVWGSWAYNSKPLISILPLFCGAGASYQGLIRARKNDVVSLGWIYGRVSNLVPGTSAEQVLEVNTAGSTAPTWPSLLTSSTSGSQADPVFREWLSPAFSCLLRFRVTSWVGTGRWRCRRRPPQPPLLFRKAWDGGGCSTRYP